MARELLQCGAIAELAQAAQTLAQFEDELFRYLQPLIGFDTACSVWSGDDGTVRNTSAHGYDPQTLRRDLPRFMAELSSAELLGFAAPEPVLDLDVVRCERRERLLVYREFLAPHRVSMFITNLWRSRFGVFGYHFGRAGRCRRFGSGQLARLRLLAPSIKLAQAMLAAEALAQLHARERSQGWAADWGLSTREREIARLVARGFQNREIAALLAASPHTIRNCLARVFRKADVSTRAELVFAIGTWTPDAGRLRCSSSRRVWSACLSLPPLLPARPGDD